MGDLSLDALLLFTDDFDGTVEFYTRGVGLTPVDDDPGAGYEVGVDWLGLATGGPLLEIFDAGVHAAPAPERGSSTVLAFRTDDLSASIEGLVANGAEVVADVIHAEWGSYAYLCHPGGPAFQVYVDQPGA